MSLFSGPEEHAANPPQTWVVVKVSDRQWSLETAGGVPLEGFTTRKAALAAREDGFSAVLYEKERRWYAGEPIPQWRLWADVKAERERRQQRQAERAGSR